MHIGIQPSLKRKAIYVTKSMKNINVFFINSKDYIRCRNLKKNQLGLFLILSQIFKKGIHILLQIK